MAELDQRQQRWDRAAQLALDIIDESRVQLMLKFRFLDLALWRMPAEAIHVTGRYALATDDMTDKYVELTMTEFALLRCLLEGDGAAVSRDTLLAKVWGFDAEVETRVTDETVRRVRRKLRDSGSATQVKAVWGYGYKLEAGS